jgi:hypothetical protein
MGDLQGPSERRARVVALATGAVVFEGSRDEAELEAEELNRSSDGSETFAVELELEPGQWGRIDTAGGFGDKR